MTCERRDKYPKVSKNIGETTKKKRKDSCTKEKGENNSYPGRSAFASNEKTPGADS